MNRKNMMKEYKDVLVGGSSYEISLTKLLGRGIKDIEGYLTTEFDEPAFKMTSVIFNDGTELGCEGEHDMPYLVQSHRKDDQRPEYKGKFIQEYENEHLMNVVKTDPSYEGEE